MAPRRYDPDATRQAILETAHRIFVERGVAETPISQVAAAAGVTKSLIHHHFGSKEELWFEIKRVAFEPFFDGILEIIRSDVSHIDALTNVVRHMFGYFHERPDMARMMAWKRMEKDNVCMDLENKVTTEGIARIAQAQAEGVIRKDLEPANIQMSFIILTTGWFQNKHMFENWPGVDPDQLSERYLEDVLTLFYGGVLAKNP